ncbi:MAG TPA: O-antigen ligase family protein [Phenylobacterium sp.]
MAFLVFVFLSVSLVNWRVAGFPVRSLYGLGLLGLLVVACPQQSALALRKHRNTLLLVAGFAVLGTLVSVIARTDVAVILRQLMEIHLQAMVNLTLAAIVVEVCGPKTLVGSFLAVVCLSMALALAQGLGIEPAWIVREALGPLLDIGGYDRSRPAGLSMNPVLLGSQLCLAIAMLYMHRRYSRPVGDLRTEPDIMALVAFGVAVAIVSGTRSPLLGIAVFIAVYLTRRLGTWAIVAGLLTAALLPLLSMLIQELQGTGARAFQTDDKSASGRWPLLAYGWRLFLANPIGYGFGFDPREHWAEHWTALSHFENAVVIAKLDLHNYILNTLNRYGAGTLLLLPLVLTLLHRHRWVLLGFAPYAFHILFHNDGPLDADYMFWFVVALTSVRIEAAPEATRPRASGLRDTRG